MARKDRIPLMGVEGVIFMEVVKKLRGYSQKVRRVQMLLKADVDGPAWTMSQRLRVRPEVGQYV